MSYNAAAWLVDRHVAAGDGGRIAIICGETQLTYAELQRQVWRAQQALRSLGVRPTERVAMVVDDEPAFVAWFLGALRSGVVPVPLSTMLTAGELAPIVNDAVADVVVASAQHAGKVDGTSARALVIVKDGDWGDFDDRSEAPVAPTSEDSPGFWLYSSGTTGMPKGVMHRHANLQATAETFARSVLGIGPDDRCLSVAKLFFAYGLGNSLTFPFSVGATSILCPDRPTPDGMAALMEAVRPTTFAASPGFVAAMLDAKVSPAVFASVRLVTTAGEALPADLHRRFTSEFGVPLIDGLGTTEALHIFLSNHLGSERPGTSGVPVEGYELRLLDDSDAEVTAPGTPGYLHVKGPSIASGYWCRTAASQGAFRGEWLRTGDVYERSEDGYWTCLGRNNDMIKAGGIWVSPTEVESVLIAHPDVLEAAVVGHRDDRGLETVVAFVVARAGHTIDEASIESHCRERMAAFKRPRRVVSVAELPRTATGKIRRFALQETLSGNS
jgi:benzoate-CoA ligase family protein